MSFGNMFGNVQVNTGIPSDLHSPSIPQSTYNGLTSMPAAPASHWMTQTPSIGSLYGMNMLGQGMNNAANLHQTENMQTAQNNLNLGNLQSALSQRGLGMAANQMQFGMQQQQQLRNMLLGMFGNMFGNVMGMLP